MKFKIALAGNPNSGKTTLFNALTGANQHVGNWPGVTVEKKSGMIKNSEHQIEVVDLPGIYSLSPYSIEEKVARNFIIEEKPDIIINIIDATNIERNLYLTTQLFELEVPVLVTLNMMDEVAKKGDVINEKMLAKMLCAPVVSISAKNKTGIVELVKEAINIATKKQLPTAKVYSDKVESILAKVEPLINQERNKRFYAIKLMECDALILEEKWVADDVKKKADNFAEVLGDTPEDRESLFAEERYGFIGKVVSASVKKNEKADDLTLSDRIDKIVTNRILAIPIFALFMYVLFQASFGILSVYLADSFEGLFGILGDSTRAMLEGIGVSEFVIGLVVDGAIGGVGGIAPFIPPIALMFVFMSLLEDSGYMARAAFIMDKIFRRFGLSGKSFIPMLMGFGCSAPAVMAARTLENERDRKLTIMLTPFMSCGARLPIYALFASALFPGNEGLVVFIIYMLGIVVAIVSGVILKGTLFKGDVAPFIIELPPYRLPSFGDLCLHVWEKLKGFIYRAGTVIVAVTMLIWLTSSYSFSLQPVADASDSILAFLGGIIAPIFTPLGFGDWQSAAALITGFAAKEAVVGTMAVIYGVGEEGLATIISQHFTQLTALSFMVFSLLYVPCAAAFMTIRRELGTWKWTWIAVGYQTGTAWVLAFLVYIIGRALGY